MTTEPLNALQVAAYVAGFLLSVPLLGILWKGAVFFAKATMKLDQIDTIAQHVSDLRHADRTDATAIEYSFTLIEGDVNAIQEKMGLPIRSYPERRLGPPDRRTA